MWNKLFRKNRKEKQLNPSNNKSDTDVTETPPTTAAKCFSFLKGKKSKVDRYKLEDNFNHFLQYETKVYPVDDFDKKFQHSQLYQPEQHQHPEDHQQLNEIFIDIPPPNLRLDLCPVCSRKFAPEALMKHVIICERINTKTRKPFDSSKQRLQGTEFKGVVASSETVVANRSQPIKYENRVSPPKMLQRKASQTSLKSQPTSSSERYTMLNSMSRKNSTMSLGGTPRMKRSVLHQNEKCPYCERVFGYKAYDRHVEWCKEKSLIKASPDVASVSAAKERMKIRVNYRAPNLKTKRGATREKYSNSCNGSTNSLADFDSHLNSMSSSITSDNGLYDPFLSAKKQLEELFSPSTTPTTQMINSMMVTPSNTDNKSNNLMSKSLTLNHVTISPKTPQPIPKMQTNFKRTSTLRLSNRKPKPTIFTPAVKSNIHCGITDDGPISPSFVKATDYDELPIKSPYSAIKLVEKSLSNKQHARNITPSQVMPVIDDKPVLRDNMLLVRKNLKLDLRNKNNPSGDYELSKTDSMALFLKYENEMTAKLSEKELKDQSNSLSKRTNAAKDNKLPDINIKPIIQQQAQPQKNNEGISNEQRPLIAIENLNKNIVETKSHSAPVKLINVNDNLPSLINDETKITNTSLDTSDTSRSPSIGRKSKDDDSPSSNRRSSSSTLRRKKKYNMDNILFDTDPDPTDSHNSSDISTSNSDSLILPEPQTPNTSILDYFDFDDFIASFQDDDQFPIFKDYKMLLKTSSKADNDNNINMKKKSSVAIQPSPKMNENVVRNLSGTTRPILIQPNQRSESKISELEKLDNLCKMLSGNSDSDESNSFETNRGESQSRSKSSADSAYGSLSRQSQSPFDYRKMSEKSMNTLRPVPPPPPTRNNFELKKTEIVLNPVRFPNFQEPAVLRTSAPINQANKESDQLSKFCHECGYKFVVPTAKFCIECGVRRLKMTN